MYIQHACLILATPTDSTAVNVETGSGRRLRSSQKRRKEEDVPEDSDSLLVVEPTTSLTPPLKETRKKKKQTSSKSKVKCETELEGLDPPPPSHQSVNQPGSSGNVSMEDQPEGGYTGTTDTSITN